MSDSTIRNLEQIEEPARAFGSPGLDARVPSKNAGPRRGAPV